MLRENTWVDKVILLLPQFKIDRLKHHLASITGADPKLLERFWVSPGRAPGNQSPLLISSSLAFALLRYGTDPCHGECAPVAHLAVLTEPFASANPSSRGGPDLEWDYSHYLESDDPRLQEKLQQIWDQRFQDDQLISVSHLSEEIPKKSSVRDAIEKIIAETSPQEPTKNVLLISQLRDKVFDPNVPSYVY